MLEKLITNLKQSLPEALQKKLGNQTTKHDSDEHEDEDDKTSVEVRYEGFDDEEIAELQEDDDSESQAVSSEESAEEKKKKQISMLIRVGVVLVLAWLVMDEFVLKKQDVAQEGKQVEVSATAGSPKEAQENPTTTETSTETETTVSANTETETPASTDSATTEAPVENINIAEQETPTEETINIEESLNSPSTSTSEETNSSLDFGQLGVNETTEASEPTTAPAEPSMDSSLGETTAKTGNDTFNYQSEDADDLATPNVAENSEIDSKIIDSPVETPVPNYENTGRGLVYNCIDKHWACIDKPSYVQCHKNNVWNKSQGKRIECATKAVYNEDADCTKVQLYYVSNNEDTGFCN